jgi:uncharacterized membrane protein
MGWMYEVIGMIVVDHKLVNRGFLIGPYCPIYGCGALLMSFLLKDYIDNPVVLFILIVVVCSFLEYTTSYLMEKIFKMRWWDYYKFKFNINGRVCLEILALFGAFGLFVMYIGNPFFLKLMDSRSDLFIYITSGTLLFIFIIDVIISTRIISRINTVSGAAAVKIKSSLDGVGDKTEVITKMVFSTIKKSSDKWKKRIISSFPDLRIVRFKIKDKK